jgi:hypothetical protein
METLRLQYDSAISNLQSVNSSFDTGVLRICYTGANRNKTYFSRETLEKCIPSLFNCPIVAHYYRADGTIGGHDVEVISDYDNQVRLVNLTQPVGVIPESANVFFETVEEDNGERHEYLCAEVILWRRQEAYKAIKENGITQQSMEINVKDGVRVDDVYIVNDFEFTAFALLGDDVEPCFESASLETYSIGSDFKSQFTEMMEEFKKSFNLTAASQEVSNSISGKGGCDLEDNKLETVDFAEDDIVDEVVDNLTDENEPVDENFALNSNISESIYAAFADATIPTEWGDMPRFCIADYDVSAEMIYVWDCTDWLLYGFSYKMEGDNVVVDFDSKKRMKYVIAEFDEGDTQESPFAFTYNKFSESIKTSNDNISELESKYQSASEQIQTLTEELETLRQFKSDVEAASDQAQREELFAQFADLNDVEEFNALMNDSSAYDLASLEEKCFAIRGRNMKLNFSAKDAKTPKLPITPNEHKVTEDVKPYGGVVEKYLKK